MKSLFGYECIVADQIKKQKKTSKHKIINWFYKKVYGYKYESLLPDGTDILVLNNKIMFRDDAMLNKIKDLIENKNFER